MNILSIESSCDDTAAAVVLHDKDKTSILSNIISSQTDLHATYGGIVPNLAGREHAKNILPVVNEALAVAGMTRGSIDAIAVTAGPGLMPALVIGVSAANALAYVWDKPLLGVHHIEGHVYANWIDESSDPTPNADTTRSHPQFPALALVVSGGHTQLMLMRDHFDYEIIGQTLDDAVGEAYDKAARILGLPYPGGPQIDKRAATYAQGNPQDTEASDLLPRPMIHSGDYNFSFSGLKTAVLYKVRDHQKQQILQKDPSLKSISKEQYNAATLPEEFVNRTCYAFQEAATDVLIQKTIKAASQHVVRSVLLAGGVSANSALRGNLAYHVAQLPQAPTFHVPQMQYCLDNAAMIGAAAAQRLASMSDDEIQTLKKTHTLANPNLPLADQI